MRWILQDVAAIGVAPARRAALAMRVIGPAALGIVASTVLVVTVAPRLGYLDPGSIGWAWSLPLLAQMIVVVVMGGVLLRAPRR